jgi:hypothetical protein
MVLLVKSHQLVRFAAHPFLKGRIDFSRWNSQHISTGHAHNGTEEQLRTKWKLPQWTECAKRSPHGLVMIHEDLFP